MLGREVNTRIISDMRLLLAAFFTTPSSYDKIGKIVFSMMEIADFSLIVLASGRALIYLTN